MAIRKGLVSSLVLSGKMITVKIKDGYFIMITFSHADRLTLYFQPKMDIWVIASLVSYSMHS